MSFPTRRKTPKKQLYYNTKNMETCCSHDQTIDGGKNALGQRIRVCANPTCSQATLGDGNWWTSAVEIKSQPPAQKIAKLVEEYGGGRAISIARWVGSEVEPEET